ncbi:MAG: exopolyphosphatase [Cytophagales bacterium]|nr:MAG: exopolyphosphatase [Cytophagales bacterium]
MNKVAIIDIGTNNFLLLIAEKQENSDEIIILHKSKAFAFIGRGGMSEKKMMPDAIERALMHLKNFRQIIDSFDCKQVIAIATSAVRNASNRQEFIEKVRQVADIHIQVIDGDREASLIYYGVKSNLQIKEPSLIMDIGGGSVEFIICNSERIFWKQSFEIGVQRLYDSFHQTDPISAEKLLALNHYVAQTLSPLFEALKIYPIKTLIGSAGSFDTIVDIYCTRYQVMNTLKSKKEFEMPLAHYWIIHEEIIVKNYNERLQIEGMITDRAEMITVASSLITFVMKQLQIEKMRVSAASLKEGILWEWLQNS